LAHFIRNSQSPAYVPVTSKSPCRRAITDGFRPPSSRLKVRLVRESGCHCTASGLDNLGRSHARCAVSPRRRPSRLYLVCTSWSLLPTAFRSRQGHPSHIVLQANTLADRQRLYFDSQLPAMLTQLLKPLVQFGLCSLRTEFGEELHDDHPKRSTVITARSVVQHHDLARLSFASCIRTTTQEKRPVGLQSILRTELTASLGRGHNFLVAVPYLNRPTTPRQSDERSCSPHNRSWG